MVDEEKLYYKLCRVSDELEKYREDVEKDPYFDEYSQAQMLNCVDNAIDAIDMLIDSIA